MINDADRKYQILKDFSKGSDEKTYLCLDEKGLFFRKIAYGDERIEILLKQVKWLLDYSNILPLASINLIYLAPERMYYDMRYCEGISFSKYICSNIDNEKNWNIMKTIFYYLENKLHSIKIMNDKSIFLDLYIEEKVINKYESILKCDNLKKFLEYEFIVVNGIKYPNLHKYKHMFVKEKLHNIFSVDIFAMIHGDLTLENIIVTDAGEFGYFIDPNYDNKFSSIFLDYSKLLQSLHGRYELVKAKNSKFEAIGNNIQIQYDNNINYKYLYEKYEKYLFGKFSFEECKSIYFHEIVHWFRLFKYRRKYEPEKIPVYYAIILKILKDVCDKFGEEID